MRSGYRISESPGASFVTAIVIAFLQIAPLVLGAAPGGRVGESDFDEFQSTDPVEIKSTGGTPLLEVSPRTKALIVQGESARKAKNYDEAIRCFTAALKLKPQKEAALIILLLRSSACLKRGNIDGALADANEVIRLDSRYPRGYQMRGRVYLRKGQLDRAIGDFNVALQLNPNFAPLYIDRGVAYSEKGQERRAIQDFDEAIRRAPHNIYGYVNRGASYYGLNDFARARADYDSAIRLRPKDPYAYFNRGLVYEKLGDWQKAIADYREAVRLNRDDPIGYAVLAAAYSEIGDFDQALKYQTQAVNMKGVSPKMHEKMRANLQRYQQHKPYLAKP